MTLEQMKAALWGACRVESENDDFESYVRSVSGDPAHDLHDTALAYLAARGDAVPPARKERYFAVCDCERVEDLGECEDFEEAFDREPPGTNFVLSEEGLRALAVNINDALGIKVAP